MAHAVTVSLTDAQHDAIAAGVPGPEPAEDRVLGYLQGQVGAIAGQHLARETSKRIAAKGLPSSLATIGLSDDQVALLEADADAKIAARAAAVTPE